jgi:DNA-binding NarL/FixJ family response regulator
MMHIAIADDHPIFRSGLRFLLENSFNDLQISEFDNGKSVLEFVKTNTPDIVIADIDMPELNGLDLCDKLVKDHFSGKVIILTMYKDIDMLKLAFFNGAKGYLVKDNTSEELVDCINTVMEGNSYLAKEVRDQSNAILPDDKRNTHIAQQIEQLTQAELKTLKLVSLKHSSREIADKLFVSVKSVENYRSRICKKLNLDARNNSLLMWVMDNKIILDNIKEFNQFDV